MRGWLDHAEHVRCPRCHSTLVLQSSAATCDTGLCQVRALRDYLDITGLTYCKCLDCARHIPGSTLRRSSRNASTASKSLRDLRRCVSACMKSARSSRDRRDRISRSRAAGDSDLAKLKNSSSITDFRSARGEERNRKRKRTISI